MTEFHLHNMRFYEFCPDAIHCIVYNNNLKCIALSRADGNIELWNCRYKPFKQHTIIASKETSVESLVWCGNRLFSAGLNGFILEYDSATYLVKKKVAVTGGPTWCLALSPNENFVAAGTEGGYVCIFSVTEEGLVYNKILKKQKSRILSIGWGEDNEHLVTGSVDFIHLISIMTEKTLQFSVARIDPNKETIIWSVALLPDKTIVTGDSRGKTCFWDGRFGTLINAIQTHQADVLAMQVTPDSQAVYVAGVDPVIVEVSLVDGGGKKGKRKMWVKSVHRRIHSHDVRSLALTQEGKLFSGGVDTYLALSFYPPKTAIKYPATPPRGYISIARKSHGILLGYKNRVELWKLGRSSSEKKDIGYLPIDEDKVKVAEIELKKNDRLEYCGVSPLSQWIACISKGGLKIYKFASLQNGEKRLEKVSCKNADILPSSQIVWLSEGKLVSATYSDILQILIVKNNEVCVQKTINIPSKSMAKRMAVLLDSSYLAVLDTSNQVTVFSLKASQGKYVVMPKAKYPVTAFALNKNEEIVITYSNMSMSEYNIEDGMCTDFGKELLNNPYNEIIKSNNVIQNISVNDSHVFLHSVSSFHVINKNIPKTLPSPRPQKTMKYDYGMDTESNDSTSPVKFSSNGRMSTVARTNHVLHFSHINEEHLIAIETNPIWLQDSLPPALKVKKFGAS